MPKTTVTKTQTPPAPWSWSRGHKTTFSTPKGVTVIAGTLYMAVHPVVRHYDDQFRPGRTDRQPGVEIFREG
jgi:hypothetical protein